MNSLRRIAAPLRFTAMTAVVAAIAIPVRGVAAIHLPALTDIPALSSSEPFRLTVSGSPQEIKVRGTGFEGSGHPNRDEYMHWQILRDGGSWERCARTILNSAATCRTTGWGSDFETIEIGGSYTASEGFVELRLFTGLAEEATTDPARAATPTEWSNVLRIPVVVPGAAPVISSLSKTSFPLSGASPDYQFLINATNLDPSAGVVFRGDVVVAPEAMSDGRIQVAVPEVYRRTTPGELSLTVRTNKGGNSAQSYIKFAAPTKVQIIPTQPILGTDIKTVDPGARIPTAAVPVGSAAVRRSEACVSGYVWREATPQDHACVTPEARARTARQNAEASSRRDPNAASGQATCRAGYVWREAVPGDVVCVTPAERTEAAEETRLAPSRVAR